MSDNPWDQYQGPLTKPDPQHGVIMKEVAIVGKDGQVWTGQGSLKKITVDEVKAMLNPDRSDILMNGVSLGGEQYTVIRDWLFDKDGTIELKAKIEQPGENGKCNVTISATKTGLVIAKGLPGIHGGMLTKNVSEVSAYLQSMNM